MQFESDGANSVLTISALTSFTGSNDGFAPTLQVSNGGSLQLTSGNLNITNAAVELTGIDSLTVGTLTLGTKGTLSGTGTITGNVINGGTLGEVSLVGELTVTGNFVQTAAGGLDFYLDDRGGPNIANWPLMAALHSAEP